MFNNHVEASKDAYAFIHLLDLVEHMSQEIFDLRQELETLDPEEMSGDDEVTKVWVGQLPKKFLN